MADLSVNETYTPDEAFDIELLGIDGAPLFNDDGTPMTIGVLGGESDTAIKARNSRTNRRLAQGQRAKMTAEGLLADSNAYLAKLTVRWNVQIGGTKPEFTYQAALALYNDPRMAFIVEQVDDAISDRSNFLKRSPTS